MSINLLDMLKDQVTGSLAKGAAGFLGESESGITKALGSGIFPALLGSMIEKGGSDEGATGLLNALKDHDGGVLDNIGGLFGGGSDAVAGLMNGGSGILSMLLGNKVGGIVDMVSKMAGLKGSTASSLIKMAAPMLMGMVGRHVRKNGLGLSGLTDMLSGQKDHVSAAMPSGWDLSKLTGLAAGAAGLVTGAAGAVTGAAGNVVGAAGDVAGGAVDAGKKVIGGAADLAGKGVGAVGDVAGGAVDAGKKVIGGAADLAGKGVGAVGDVAEGAAKTGGSILKWLLPLFLVLMAAGYFFGFQTGCGAIDDTVNKANDLTENAAGAVGDVAGGAVDVVGDVAGGAVDIAGDVAGGAMDLAKGAFGAVNDVALKALDGVEWAAGSVGSQMMDFVKGGFKGEGRFKFNNLTFATGSAAIAGDSGVEVDNLAKILAAYPDAKINIEGYTDNTGDAAANVELSKARAEAVKARLGAAGVAGTRVSTQGFGADNPTASNDTPEGRAQNRRIEVTFMK